MREEVSAFVATGQEGLRRRDRTPHWADWTTVWLMNYAGDTAGAEAFAPGALAKSEEFGWKSNSILIRLGWSFALRHNGKAG